ncbi:hypothetical protein MPH_13246, partial [Macrophomina phaseolina MS6]
YTLLSNWRVWYLFWAIPTDSGGEVNIPASAAPFETIVRRCSSMAMKPSHTIRALAGLIKLMQMQVVDGMFVADDPDSVQGARTSRNEQEIIWLRTKDQPVCQAAIPRWFRRDRKRYPNRALARP